MLEFILYVEDQNKSRDFYQNLLQQNPVLDVNGMTEFMLSDNCKLGLMPSTGIFKILGTSIPHPSQGKGIPRCELYLFLGDVNTCLHRALEVGATLISEAAFRDWGDRVAYVSDPDGHIIAFAERPN